jgi:carotenoid cleavage dioxygenase
MNARLSLALTANPYLRGDFGPIGTEDDFDPRIVCNLPEGLNGALYRIGPTHMFAAG